MCFLLFYCRFVLDALQLLTYIIGLTIFSWRSDLKTATGFLWRPRDTAWTRQITSPQMQTVPVSPQNITKSIHATSEDYRKDFAMGKDLTRAPLCEKKPSDAERLIFKLTFRFSFLNLTLHDEINENWKLKVQLFNCIQILTTKWSTKHTLT